MIEIDLFERVVLHPCILVIVECHGPILLIMKVKKNKNAHNSITMESKYITHAYIQIAYAFSIPMSLILQQRSLCFGETVFLFSY